MIKITSLKTKLTSDKTLTENIERSFKVKKEKTKFIQKTEC